MEESLSLSTLMTNAAEEGQVILKQVTLNENDYGMKICSVIPAILSLILMLFMLQRAEEHARVKKRILGSIDSFKSVCLSHYQFNLRYTKQTATYRNRFLTHNPNANNNISNDIALPIEYYKFNSGKIFPDADIYVDNLDNEKEYLVKHFKIASFQNQDYVNEYIKTLMFLQRFAGVSKMKHFCIAQGQFAKIVKEIPDSSLAQQIEQKIETLDRFEDTEILQIALDVVKTLAEVEEIAHMPHRDIRPASILKHFDGKYKLTNFRPKNFDVQKNYLLLISQGSLPFMAPQLRFQIELQMGNLMNNIDMNDQEEDDNQGDDDAGDNSRVISLDVNERKRSHIEEGIDNLTRDQNDRDNLEKGVSMESDENFLILNPNEMTEQDVAFELHDLYKCDVFSLGLTLLLATTKTGVDGLNINKDLLQARINKLNQIPYYTETTKNLIKQMLQWEEEERPSLRELLKLFPGYKEDSSTSSMIELQYS